MKTAVFLNKARQAFAVMGHDVGRFRRRDCGGSFVAWCALCHRPAFVTAAGEPSGTILRERCAGHPEGREAAA